MGKLCWKGSGIGRTWYLTLCSFPRSPQQIHPNDTGDVMSKLLVTCFLVSFYSLLAGCGGGDTTAQTYSVYDLGGLNGNVSQARGVNNIGQVVGSSTAGDNASFHAVLFSNGTVNNLGTLLGGLYSHAISINNSAQAVGWASTGGSNINNTYAALFSNGIVTNLGALPMGTKSYASSINDAGQAVGASATKGAYDYHAVLFSNGTVTDLGTLGGSRSLAASINKSGQIAGTAYIDDYNYHAALFSNGRVIDLGTLDGGSWSEATSMNDSGQVVGSSHNASGHFRAALFLNGTVTELGTLAGGISSHANCINNLGQAVGNASTADGSLHAVIFKNGTVTDLNTVVRSANDWTLIDAYSINDKGLIVAVGLLNGQVHAALLTPGMD